MAKRQKSARDFERQAERKAQNAYKHGVYPRQRISADVMATLAELQSQPRSLIAVLMGDPLPGRSALDHRGRA